MTTALTRSARLLLVGAPGAGKGTLTDRLLTNFSGLEAISTGDLLRREIKNESKIGVAARSIIKAGGLVPDNTISQLLQTELETKGWLNADSSWILDGFPRNRAQAEVLDEMLLPHKANLSHVVQLDVPEEVILDRIENRWVHLASGRIYNLTFNPPKVAGKDDVTGEPLSKREDDKPEVFKKRLVAYKQETEPLFEFYEKRGVLVTLKGETSNIIWPKLEQLIKTEYC
ncbi:adenylate kinase-domain-containing protein [Yarrowia lipolytica]|jgi:adenylate kinase|uniref:GTP:AMP phosphotransferase, mitochondrial n=2 Tax=Yarrowia lipolytica TaxID=4952 RepID=Q6C0A1_YARLI|nr:YALI0F26521p [Yarrowia lipolytica CLIB122]AOW07744.1 hypothetical protein YALI1_F33951g [Yarrowia lipolytica]KAB8284545.1 adenylate kinase-domain-containing protein [Yarrowia lipolytica]KAE8174414.1 adenylate kinase-domain-containing protein [Yarrowia lipolytica]KAJ8055204.1 adenylate kinase-domain-containing protein [Yarrowia lipolytica]QNP99439.1 GTP:AMP phosphotransferase [Yarrowia lipolytica]|eukprot:XP_505911.1 YALI0F26521p [Yarrowia lipolytica CLIB122]